MDKFAAMKGFVKAVEAGSFAAAGREMGVSRSQVNRLVIALEDDLGVQLLNRTTRSISVTPAGENYYQRARVILNDLQEAQLSIQSEQREPQGEIRINAPHSFGVRHLAPALIEFLRLYPAISVQLALSDQFIDPVADGFDITLRIAKRVDNPALIEHEITQARRVLCASPEFLKRYGPIERPQQLATIPCLHYGNLPTGNNWRLLRNEGYVDVQVNGVLCANNADVLCDAAISGLGVALMPIFIAEEALANGRLLPILEEYSLPPIYLSLVYPPSRHLSVRIRLLVNFIQEWFDQAKF